MCMSKLILAENGGDPFHVIRGAGIELVCVGGDPLQSLGQQRETRTGHKTKKERSTNAFQVSV